MTETLEQALDTAISYETYLSKVAQWVSEGKTSGPLQTESLANYTKLNLKRMQRLNKTSRPSLEITSLAQNINFNTRWVVISEAWCGDAAQNLPYIAALAAQLPKASLEIVFRDENPEFMDQYLTNGSRSIPKLVIFKTSTLQELAVWGPRPAEVQEMVTAYKNEPGEKESFDAFSTRIHAWYTANKNLALESELFSIFNQLQP